MYVCEFERFEFEYEFVKYVTLNSYNKNAFHFLHNNIF